MNSLLMKVIITICLTAIALNAKEILSGKIIEVINASGYSYIKVKTKNDGSRWAAVLEGDFKKNEQVKVIYEFKIKQFKSKTLDKSFENIAFGLVEENREKISQEVKRTTIDELVKKSSSFNNQIIQTEGIVTKVSRGIMHSNWVHIQDEKGNKLVFRTNEDNIQLGDQVVATGKAATNLDYGHGYKYDIIILNTTIEQKFDRYQV